VNNPDQSAGEALLKVLNSEPVRNLLSPITKQLGEALGDIGSVVHFYCRRNLERIFAKWAESRQTISPADFEKITPLLLLAATASDGELQTRWAALLESAVTGNEGFLPSFGRTLSELTAEEAQYLDRIWSVVSETTRYLPEYRSGRQPISFMNLVEIFDPNINTGMNPAEMELFRSRMSFEQIANYERLGHVELVIQDLERLGIIAREPVAEPDRYLPMGDQKIPVGRSKTVLRWEYSFTQYGVSFVRVVATKKSVLI
jgi:hypothetical protein